MAAHNLSEIQVKQRLDKLARNPAYNSIVYAVVKAGLVKLPSNPGQWVYGDSADPPAWFDRIMSGSDPL